MNRNVTQRSSIAMMLLLLVVTLTANSGCRTAASFGIPVASGNNPLLSSAVSIRQDVGHQADLPTELAKAALQPHRMEAGDVIVIEPNDFNGPVRLQSDQTVQQDGTIDLGSYGRVYVAGHSTFEIQQKVEQSIKQVEFAKRERRIALATYNGTPPTPEEDVDLGVTVRLVNQESSNIYVMGEVNAPGSYPIDGNETVLDALISAGGLTGNSNDHKIILTRPQLGGAPRVILPVCYQQILQLGDVSTNYQLQPGDRIYVPSMTIWEDIRLSLQWNNEKSCPHCFDYSKQTR